MDDQNTERKIPSLKDLEYCSETNINRARAFYEKMKMLPRHEFRMKMLELSKEDVFDFQSFIADDKIGGWSYALSKTQRKLTRLQKMTEWISVDEITPQKKVRIELFCEREHKNDPQNVFGIYTGDTYVPFTSWDFHEDENVKVTHYRYTTKPVTFNETF